jgi:hypothetical protein
MTRHKHARNCFRATIRAAQEANHDDLQATGWSWMSLACAYDGDPQAALTCIQTARHVATSSTHTTVRAWLAALDAEAQAKLHHDDACRRALDEAELVEDPGQLQRVHYWTSYDRIQLEGYKGTCSRHLYSPEKTQTRSYLLEAQEILKEALEQSEPVLARLQSTFLSDLADTYAKQKKLGEAYSLARQALLKNIPQSQMIVQRVLMLRQDVEPWKDTQEVRELDAQLLPLLPSAGQRGMG